MKTSNLLCRIVRIILAIDILAAVILLFSLGTSYFNISQQQSLISEQQAQKYLSQVTAAIDSLPEVQNYQLLADSIAAADSIASDSLSADSINFEIEKEIIVDSSFYVLAHKVDSLKPLPHVQIAIIDQDHCIISHPNRDYILKWNIRQAMRRVGIDPDTQPLHHVKERKSGCSKVKMGSSDTYVYYAPLAHNNWTVLLYIPENVVYETVNATTQQTLHNGTIILIIIIISAIAFGLSFLKKKHPEVNE